MVGKPTYEELEQRVQELEKKAAKLRQAEEAAEYAYAELDQIFETAADGMRVIDKDFNVVRVNETLSTLSGINKDKAVDKKCYEVFQGPLCHTQGCPLTRILGGEERVESDVERERNDGVTVPCIVTATPFRGPGGELIGIIEDFKDITERKQAEEALSESEEKFRSITTSAKDAIIMMDDEGNNTHWNKAAEEIFGYSAQEALGKEFHIFLAPQQYHNAYRKGMGTFKTTGQGLVVGKTLEVEAVKKDGTILPIELSVSSVKLKGKWHATGIIRDITDRKRAESIQQEKVKAEAASATKSEFLAKMSHEIRTPMNGVIGMTGLLLDTELTPEQREYADTVRNSASSLLTLINDILDYSKIEAGKLDLENIDFDLRKTIKEVTNALTIEAHKKGLKFACLIHHNVPALVRGDPGRFRK
jgi:PAS domain S-box-containing protein